MNKSCKGTVLRIPKEKNIQEQRDKKELAQVLKSFFVEARKKDGKKTMDKITIIRFGFCDIQNNQGLV